MISPRLPAACAEPAKTTSAAVIVPAASFRARSEIRSKLHTAWTDHRPAPLKPREPTRGCTVGVRLRAAADCKVEHGAEHQACATHRESDRGDIAFLLGRIDCISASRWAIVILTLPVELVLVLHR